MTTSTQEPEVKWSQDQMVEVLLNEPDDFLKVRETLTRIGVASRKENNRTYQNNVIVVSSSLFIRETTQCILPYSP